MLKKYSGLTYLAAIRYTVAARVWDLIYKKTEKSVERKLIRFMVL